MGLLDGIFGRPAAHTRAAVGADGATNVQSPTASSVEQRQPEARPPQRQGRPIGGSAFLRALGLGTAHVTVGGRSIACSAAAAEALTALALRPLAGVKDIGVAAKVIDEAFPFATARLPHAGLRVDAPWNFAALLRLAPEDAKTVSAALVRYHAPSFVNADMNDKRAVLAALAPITEPAMQTRLERWHLPRLAATSTQLPVTLAIESESTDLSKIYRYYAPHPAGQLDLQAITPALRDKLLAPKTSSVRRARTPVELRMSDTAWLANLRWKELSPAAQHEYLEGYQQTVDPKVTLHRLTDPSHTADGEVAPATLQDTLKWEREQRLQIAELITKSSYSSLDAQRADREWISRHVPGGFHLHAVTELSSAEDKQRLGPKFTAVAALHDLALFAAAARSNHTNYTHVFLEPWTAGFANEVAASFDKGTLDADTILPHKFHWVGMRTGIYGQEDRLGIEVRGVQLTLDAKFDHAADRLVELISGGGLERLPSPPWPGWDAGDKNVGAAFEKQARQALKLRGPRGAQLAETAKLSFDDVMDLVTRGSRQKNGFAFAAPLWNFEAIPGLTSAEKTRIAVARLAFTDVLLTMSEMVSTQIEQGRDLDALAPHVFRKVITAAMAFFEGAGVDLAIERILDEAAAPIAPAPQHPGGQGPA